MANEVVETIIEQLGGRRFSAMTGSKNYIADGNTLRMTLVKSESRANRLWITYDPVTDTYSVRFFRYTAPHLRGKSLQFIEEKVEEVVKYTGVYADQLCPLFTAVTGLRTSL